MDTREMPAFAQGDHSRSKKPRIILIDDDRAFLEKLADSVERIGFNCDAVCDSNRAIEKIGREVFDIIVTDISMPGLNGLDIIDTVRKKSAHSLIIVITGNGDSSTEKSVFAHGADIFLRKPLNLAAFLQTIRRYDSLPEKTSNSE